MVRFRAPFAALIALLFYTMTDILVWQRIFESNQLIEFADTYHIGWLASLAGYAIVGVVVMSDRWKDCLFYLAALVIGAYSGLEDVLYYVLDGKAMPESLPWLSRNPLILGISRTSVIASAAFWLTALAILYLTLLVWRRPRSEPASSVIQTSLDSRVRGQPARR